MVNLMAAGPESPGPDGAARGTCRWCPEDASVPPGRSGTLTESTRTRKPINSSLQISRQGRPRAPDAWLPCLDQGTPGPELDRAVPVRGGERPPVGREGQREDVSPGP